MNDKVWALVHPANKTGSVVLYSANLTDQASPVLTRVRAVEPMPDTAADGDAIAVQGASVSVIGGSTTFWSTSDGVRWHRGKTPCARGTASARLAQWIGGGVVAACGAQTRAGEDIRVYESTDGGKSWTALPQPPTSSGQLTTLGAGTAANIIVGTSGGGSELTRDAGRHWESPNPDGIALGFVGFISDTTIVAIPDRESTAAAAFLSSGDAGQRWAVTRFSP